MSHSIKQLDARSWLYGLLAMTLIACGYIYYQESNVNQVVSAMPVKVRDTGHFLPVSTKEVSSASVIPQTSRRVFYNPSIDVFAAIKNVEEKPPEPTHAEIVAEAKIQTVDIQPATVVQPVSPPPPSAPPVPFKYIGKLYGDDEYIVFLQLHGKNISAKTGDTIAQSYKIEEINPPLMTATYLPLNIKQTLDIGAP